MGVAARGEQRFNRLLHGGRGVVVRQGRWLTVKQRIGFQRQVIGREMRRFKVERALNIGDCLRHALPRQPVHQIQIEIAEMLARGVYRMARFAGVVDAPQRLEVGVVEALYP